METWEPSYFASGNVKWYSHLKNHLTVFKMLKMELPQRSSYFTPGYTPKSNENLCPRKNLNMHVHRHIMYNNRNLKQIKYPLINQWINKMWYIHMTHLTLKRNKVVTHATTQVSLQNIILNKRDQSKDHKQCDNFHKLVHNRLIYRDRTQIRGWLGLAVRGREAGIRSDC